MAVVERRCACAGSCGRPASRPSETGLHGGRAVVVPIAASSVSVSRAYSRIERERGRACPGTGPSSRSCSAWRARSSRSPRRSRASRPSSVTSSQTQTKHLPPPRRATGAGATALADLARDRADGLDARGEVASGRRRRAPRRTRSARRPGRAASRRAGGPPDIDEQVAGDRLAVDSTRRAGPCARRAAIRCGARARAGRRPRRRRRRPRRASRRRRARARRRATTTARSPGLIAKSRDEAARPRSAASRRRGRCPGRRAAARAPRSRRRSARRGSGAAAFPRRRGRGRPRRCRARARGRRSRRRELEPRAARAARRRARHARPLAAWPRAAASSPAAPPPITSTSRAPVLDVEAAVRRRVLVHLAEAGDAAQELLVERPRPPRPDHRPVVEADRRERPADLVDDADQVAVERADARSAARPRRSVADGLGADADVRDAVDLHHAVGAAARAAEQPARAVVLEAAREDALARRVERRADRVAGEGLDRLALEREGDASARGRCRSPARGASLTPAPLRRRDLDLQHLVRARVALGDGTRPRSRGGGTTTRAARPATLRRK